MLFRVIPLLFLSLLAACNSVSTSMVDPQQDAPATVSRSAFDAPATVSRSVFDAAVSRVGPIASNLCRDQNPTEGATFCNFDFQLTGSAFGPRQAIQTRDANGRPVVSFSRSMLNASETVDEVAFILAHEAGHQIADHRGTLNGFQPEGSSSGFRIYVQNTEPLELEADVIAMMIVAQAGFVPERGLDAIARFGGPVGFHSGSHPEVSQRLAVAQRTIDVIRSGQRINLN